MRNSFPKKILLIGGNYFPEPTGIGKYNGEMIDMLAQMGYSCTVVTSYPYYPYWKIQEPYTKHASWYSTEFKITTRNLTHPVEIHRCPQYVPHNPSGSTRMLLDLSFLFFALCKVARLLLTNRYDYVITVAPCFQVGFLGMFCRLLKGSKFIYHIQDLQVDAASELNMIKSKKLLHMLFAMEKFILKRADIVSSISKGMIDKIHAKYARDIVYFPNWVDTNSFYPLTKNDGLKEQFNLKETDIVFLYSGAIGEKQGLENLIYAAESFRKITHVKFVICGAGPYKKKLECLTEELQLENIVFLDTQPFEKLNLLLNMADYHLVLQKANAADLVMPSKLTSILSVGGVAIVSATPNSTLYELISGNEIGIVIPPDSKSSLIKAITSSLLSNYDHIKNNARRYAEEFLSSERILQSYLQCIK